MFNSKKKQLWETPVATSGNSTGNSFLQSGMKQSNVVYSENSAKKYKSSGYDFVDQFGRIGEFKTPRQYSAIDKDMRLIYSQNPSLTVAFTVYLRLISRRTNLLGNKLPVQYGAGLKHESIMRMFWLEQQNPEQFYNNLIVFVAAGSWKDVFQMLQIDLAYNGWEGRVLDWEKMGNFIVSGLNTASEVNLVKKYLPQIRAKSKCKTVEAQANTTIGKWIASLLFGNKKQSEGATYKQYRMLKNSGNAHQWQQLISQGKFDLINFDEIHGRALRQLVNSKFLENQGLKDKYEAFITDETVETVKFTGFVHELFQNYSRGTDKIRRQTIDKQFNQLVAQAKDEEKYSNFIVVRDTSSSMSQMADGTAGMSCYDLGKALALYMSEFLSGPFANHWIEFNSDAKMHEWKGTTATDKWDNDRSGFYGSTNFESVLNLFADLKRQGFAKEEDFPTGIICISDSEFDPTGKNRWSWRSTGGTLDRTNVENAKQVLRNAGFSKQYVDDFVIVLWNTARGQSFKTETHGFAPNVFYYSGFDASTIALLTGGGIKTARDLFEEAMNQEIMHYLTK